MDNADKLEIPELINSIFDDILSENIALKKIEHHTGKVTLDERLNDADCCVIKYRSELSPLLLTFSIHATVLGNEVLVMELYENDARKAREFIIKDGDNGSISGSHDYPKGKDIFKLITKFNLDNP